VSAGTPILSPPFLWPVGTVALAGIFVPSRGPMKRTRFSWSLGAIVIVLTLGHASAWALSLEHDVRALSNPDQQKAILEQVRDLAAPDWKLVLSALKEGALYKWKNQLIILTDEGNYTGVDGKPLLDEKGQPLAPEEGLEAVALDESNSHLLQQALDAIVLLHADVESRRGVALKLGSLHDEFSHQLIQRALESETDASVKAVLSEALYKEQLTDADPKVRLRAVEFFARSRSEYALGPLRRMVDKESDPAVRAAMTSAVSTIESHLRIRAIVGYAFNGVSLASVLLIMSLGLAITFGLMGIINMAHGEMLMLGSYTAYVVQEIFAAHWPAYQNYFFPVALPLSIVVVGTVGLILEFGILRFLYRRPLESLLVTWGIGMIFQQGARLCFGDQTSVNAPSWFRGGVEVMSGLVFPYSRIFIIVLSVLCLLAVYWLLNHSTAGLRIRAVMQNRDMAACVGISTRRVDALTFALGTALAGVGGCALSLIGTVDPEVGRTYIVDSFMVVVLGGVGKLLGTVLASFGIGMSNKLLEPAIGGTASAVYAKVGILALVIFILQLRPTGLFPAKERATEVMGR
jgi:urea transport system permease protein